MSETTVRDIEWWVNPEFTPWVSAEDEKLFPAGIYAQQVCDEHNGYQAMKRALKERDALLRSIIEWFDGGQRIASLEDQIENIRPLVGQSQRPAQSGGEAEGEDSEH